MISVGAEADVVHPVSMLDGGFFLPLLVNKTPDLSGVIKKGYYKASSVGTEADVVRYVSTQGGFCIFAEKKTFLGLMFWQ